MRRAVVLFAFAAVALLIGAAIGELSLGAPETGAPGWAARPTDPVSPLGAGRPAARRP